MLGGLQMCELCPSAREWGDGVGFSMGGDFPWSVCHAECLNWTFYGKVSEGQILHDEIM